ncbi:MAG: hypothetical protein ABIA59_05840, partial [Candidatus Latescibacterota bacterium]
MNFVSGIRSVRGFMLVLILPLVLVAFMGCGDDDPVAVKKTAPNKVLQLDGDGDYLSISFGDHNFATFTVEALVKVPTYEENVHYISLFQNAYLVLGDWATGQISTWAAGLTPVDAGGAGTEPSVTTDEWHHFAFSFDGV